jgi:hypothetical protein
MASAASLAAQAPRDTAVVLDVVAKEVVRLGAAYGASIWPGYRPDTIPLAFVLPTHGTFLLNWHGSLPTGYRAIEGMPGVAWREQKDLGAASTGTAIDGRRVAQISVGPTQALEPASLLSTAFHEAFHVFQHVSVRDGKRFGSGENSALVGSYPVFDVENETGFALEGHILADATAAATLARKRELARAFVGVRLARHRRLNGDLTDFDRMSELNEGLAQYALTRALKLVISDGPKAWRPNAAKQLADMRAELSDLTGAQNMSLRFRFYQTGPALASLLDDLAGEQWKVWIMRDNWTLEDALAHAVGVDAASEQAQHRAESAYKLRAVRASAERNIEKLRASRLAKVDSVLSAPGIKLVLAADSLPGRNFNSCGYDPQNVLQVTPRLRIQTRWWRPCAGGPTYAEFNVPSVQSDDAGTVSAVIGAESDLRVASGTETIVLRDGETLRDVKTFKLEAPRASVEAVRADLSRRGNVITVYPKRPVP